jgi:hypothetical protein
MKRLLPGDFLWLAVLAAVTAFFIIPATNKVFVSLTAAHPYGMGFLKFAILATMGELLARRMGSGKWHRPAGLVWRILIWGLIGVAITFMFSFFSLGAAAMIEKGLLPAGSGWLKKLLQAFYTSAIMNLTFGPVFMAAHRISDTYLDLHAQGNKPGMKAVLAAIDWLGFLDFVVGKTIPLWWIPAHTVTFLLPGEYRVLVAAYLSIVLGVILIYARRKKVVINS